MSRIHLLTCLALLMTVGLPVVLAEQPEEKLTELRALANSASEQASPLAQREVRRTSGIWLPPGSVERRLHEFALQILRDANELDVLIAEVERERATAASESDPPLVQVLAGLYEAQGKAAIAQRLYHEAWQQKRDDPWLNLKVAEMFQTSREPDRMVEALSLVWEQAPEMILADAYPVGMRYVSANRTDAFLEALTRLEPPSTMAAESHGWTQLVMPLQSARLPVERLEPIYEAVMKVAPQSERPEIARQRGSLLVRNQKWSAAYDTLSNELFFNPAFATEESSSSPQGVAAAHVAIRGVSEFADAASRSARLERLADDSRALLELADDWRAVGELLLAAVARRLGDEKPLVELARRAQVEFTEHSVYDNRTWALLGELMKSKSRPAIELCLALKEALEPALLRQGASPGRLRHEQAQLHVRLGHLDEARELWLSVAEGVPQSDQSLRDLSLAAEQFNAHGFLNDSLRLYQRLLHDWLPARPDSPVKDHVATSVRRALGQTLGTIGEHSQKLDPEKQHALLEVLLDMLFGDGRHEEPILPAKLAVRSGGHTEIEGTSRAPQTSARIDFIPELAPAVLQLASMTNALAGLRQEWATHPAHDSMALLTLRAEAAAVAEDTKDLSQLIRQIDRVEAESGVTPPFWSVRCLLYGLGERFRDAFLFDFRDRNLDRTAFDLSGKSSWLIKPEPEGLRIRVPPNTGPIGHVGVKSRFQIHGDFEAVATYEILQIDTPVPPKSYGGAMLIAEFSDSAEHTNLRRERRPDGADVYTAHHHSLNAQEQTQTVVRHSPTQASQGQMALVRRGSTMYWLAKDDSDSEFRLLLQDTCGTQDVSTLKLAIDSWGTQSLTDFRWIELTVRAEKLVDLPAEFLRRPSEIASRGVTWPAASPRRWHWWLIGAICLISLVAAGVRIHLAR